MILTPFLNYNEYPNQSKVWLPTSPFWTWVACPPNLDLTVHNKAVNWSVIISWMKSWTTVTKTLSDWDRYVLAPVIWVRFSSNSRSARLRSCFLIDGVCCLHIWPETRSYNSDLKKRSNQFMLVAHALKGGKRESLLFLQFVISWFSGN